MLLLLLLLNGKIFIKIYKNICYRIWRKKEFYRNIARKNKNILKKYSSPDDNSNNRNFNGYLM